MFVETHFRNTEELLRSVPTDEIASWLLGTGFYPESNILPPSFQVSGFDLKGEVYNKDLASLTRRKLVNISYPKTLLASRNFGIQHPWNYHDMVFHLMNEWDFILDHLFHKDIKIYSYSLPIPVSKKHENGLSELRAGRMIYEWITMAEKDLVLDSISYQYIAKTDVTNFYASIYTHSIGWALHGRETAFNDKNFALLGNKLDRLIAYSNDARTNGISVGPALSDLIAEIILAGIDKRASEQLSKIDFVAVRFKDDYRILCHSKSDANTVLRTISNELSKFNLSLNENKTSVLKLPDGIYRKHDREYFPHSLRDIKKVSFKVFEHTLLIVLNIHRNNLGTSMLEKFISELFNNRKEFKVVFSKSNLEKERQIKKIITLLFLVKRESEKFICHALSVVEQLYLENIKTFPDLKVYLKELISKEIAEASKRESVFEVVWLIYFVRHIGLGITNYKELVGDSSVVNNVIYKSMLLSQQKIFPDSGIVLFRKPSDCKGESLIQYLSVFKDNVGDRNQEAALFMAKIFGDEFANTKDVIKGNRN